MNRLQETILQIIHKIANTEGFADYGDDVLYGFKNYIARHSLASDTYFVSENAFASFPQFSLTLPLARGKISKLKADFTFEHPVPASVTATAIKNSDRSLGAVTAILSFADCVTLVTKEEDRAMHTHLMPTDWLFLKGSSFARYELAAIRIRTEKIPMKGRLVR